MRCGPNLASILSIDMHLLWDFNAELPVCRPEGSVRFVVGRPCQRSLQPFQRRMLDDGSQRIRGAGGFQHDVRTNPLILVRKRLPTKTVHSYISDRRCTKLLGSIRVRLRQKACHTESIASGTGAPLRTAVEDRCNRRHPTPPPKGLPRTLRVTMCIQSPQAPSDAQVLTAHACTASGFADPLAD